MNNQDAKSPSDLIDTHRILDAHRERLIELEADGIAADDAEGLWDVMAGLLAEMKRHQALIG
jgi:hypothetical protein